MFGNKFKFTYDEIKIIVMALVDLKNKLIEMKCLRVKKLRLLVVLHMIHI